MVLNKSNHKSYVFSLFYPLVNGLRQEKTFPLEKLFDASSCLKKIKEAAKENETENGSNFVWKDGPLELTTGETIIVKELVNALREATPSEVDIISELKELVK